MTLTHPASPAARFEGLGIAPGLLDALSELKFSVPTPIQHAAIPAAIAGKDIIGIAQSGTGKTIAFGIPTVQRLAQGPGMALVVVPTRELALQVEEVLRTLGRFLGIRSAVLIGGSSFEEQRRALGRRPHLLIATPGRLLDHLERRTVSVRTVRILVLDEADRMLDMGFAPQIQRILRALPTERQTLLFSATMPSSIVKIAMAHMKLPVRVEVVPPGTPSEHVDQELFIVQREAKNQLLEKLLAEYRGTVLIFSRTKHGAKKITRNVQHLGHTVAEIHSNRSLAQRRRALWGFKTGVFRVLVATDIAARGIDVTGIELVINYDLPDNHHDYIHRIGRTGRAGREGRAITFATPQQTADVRHIEQLMRSVLRVSRLPALPPRRPSPDPAASGGVQAQRARPWRAHSARPWRRKTFSRRTGM